MVGRMKNTAKVKYPKYDQEKVVKDMQDRMWRAIEGCTMEEYFDKVRELEKRDRPAQWWDA